MLSRFTTRLFTHTTPISRPFFTHRIPRLAYSTASMPSPPKLQNVSVTIDSSAIAIVKYNRPQNANALNVAVVKDVLEALKWAEAEKAVRVVVTTGEGKFYTAGLDLLDPSNNQEGATICDEFVDILGQIHETIINTNKLVVSAVNGPAPGWGTSSIALSDLVYSAPDAIFFTPFVQWGFCAEGCSSSSFIRIMGRQKASALILAGARMSAQELESAGLVTKILPKENFFDEVLKILRGIVKLPEEALRVNKELMVRKIRPELLETNRTELELLKKQVRKKESLDAVEGYRKETERRRAEKKAKL